VTVINGKFWRHRIIFGLSHLTIGRRKRTARQSYTWHIISLAKICQIIKSFPTSTIEYQTNSSETTNVYLCDIFCYLVNTTRTAFAGRLRWTTNTVHDRSRPHVAHTYSDNITCTHKYHLPHGHDERLITSHYWRPPPPRPSAVTNIATARYIILPHGKSHQCDKQ